MNEDAHTISSGFLEVGNGHTIYYQQWGNIKSKPIFFLHGGPGSGCKDTYKTFFDPRKHHVIYHDQRGSGKSTPFAEIAHNTTQDLVEDIEKLRKHFKFSKIGIAGGSWGSFLGFTYAIAFPNTVSNMVLWSIFGGTKAELDYIQQGGLATHYPESWNQYIEVVPEEYRENTVNYYLNKMLHGSQSEIEDHVKRWVLLELSAMSIDSDIAKEALTAVYSDESKSLAILEAHYFNNSCFVPDQYVFNNLSLINHIPTILVHGRYDHICPPETAYKFSEVIKQRGHLHIVPASHGREGALRETVRAYVWSLM